MPFAQLGLRAGAFLVLPARRSDRRLRHQSGARAERHGPRRSSRSAPELIARSDWTRHEVTATLRGSYTAYDQTPELDRPAFDGKVTGRLDVTRNTALIGEGTLIVGTDNPGSPNVQAGLTRFPIYTTLGGTFGLTQRFNRIEVTAKGDGRAHRVPGLAVHRRHHRQQRRPRLQSLRRHAAHELRSDAGAQAVRRGRRRHARARSRSSTASACSATRPAGPLKGGTTFEFSRMLTGEAAIG